MDDWKYPEEFLTQTSRHDQKLDTKLDSLVVPIPPRKMPSSEHIGQLVSGQAMASVAPSGGRYSESQTLAAPPPLNKPLSAPAGSFPTVDLKPVNSAPPLPHTVSAIEPGNRAVPSDDSEHHNHFAYRFVGNMFPVRLGRAGFQSMASTMKLPMYLSPWGDNNPVTLPNVRRRDIALMGVSDCIADTLVDSSLTCAEMAFQHAITWTAMTMSAEQTVDETLDKVTGKDGIVITRNMGVLTLEIHIRHKLIGEHAALRLYEERDTKDWMGCAKGWFCPFLYASARAPVLSRAKDFTMVELIAPGLKADAGLAPMVLSALTKQRGHVAGLCDYSPENQSGIPKYQRLAVLFLGITPYRTSAWSQARLPSEARLKVHLCGHLPALVLPVKPNTPVLAWSPWTMQQIINQQDNYDMSLHQAELFRYLESILDPSLIDRAVETRWRQIVIQALAQILNGIQTLPNKPGVLTGHFESTNAGIVMFRY